MIDVLLRVVAGVAIAAVAGAIAIKVITKQNIFDLLKKKIKEDNDADIVADDILAARIVKAAENSVSVEVFFGDLEAEDVHVKVKDIKDATVDESLVGEMIIVPAIC